MLTYFDYKEWLEEDKEIVSLLRKSNMLERYEHIFLVVEYYYNRRDENEDYEEDIFQAGFNYIFNIVNKIKIWIKEFYNNNSIEFQKYRKTLHYLLLIQDILEETEGFSDIEELENLEQKALNLLKNKKIVEDTMYPLLDDLTSKIFFNNKRDFKGYVEIFYEIAENLNLV